MQCAKHPEHAADGMCAYSGKPFCSHELVEVDGRFYAKDNVGKVIAAAKQAAPQAPAVYMNAGGGGAAATSVAVAERPKVNHALHIVLTVLSAGLWLPVYLIILLSRSC